MALSVGGLTAEHLVDPLGLQRPRPRLSWQIRDSRVGTRQVAYRLLTDGWDSGRVAGTGCTDVPWPGPTAQRVSWRVQVWVADGRTVTSAPAVFEQGLASWTASWICRPLPTDAHDAHRPAAHLRTTFELPAEPVRARLHVTAGGLYEAWLNGSVVGEDRLAPGWTDYHHRVRARTHDVTAGLRAGRNALGLVVMDGWYAGYVGWDHLREHYGRTPVARAELVVELAGGERVHVVSDERWRGRHGPIRSGDLLAGELYDARFELPGWAEPDYDDGDWEPAWPDPGPAGAVVPTPCPPVRRLGEVAPVRQHEVDPGSRVVDLGEEVVGWPRLSVDAAPGSVVRLRCAEALDADGRLWTANLRGAACTDTYVVAAPGPQTWEPRSTFRAFRYVEVTGPATAEVTGVLAHTDARPTGDFACSADDLTDLWAAARRTVRANLVSLPTDCPQRDERLGWLADVEVGLELSAFLYDIGDVHAAWLADVRSGQSADGAFPDVAPRLAHTADGAPGWGDAGVAVPWGLWQWFGDREVLADNLAAMARWPQWIAAQNPGGVWRAGRGRDYGDWLAPAPTPPELLATAWWFRSCDLVARSAALLDRPDVRGPAERLRERVRAGFAQAWSAAWDTGGPPTQTALLLAEEFGLLPAAQVHPALVADVQRHGVTTGFQGVRHLLPALTRAGRADLAYALALQPEQPGWVAMLRHGATTFWERWDARTGDGFADPYLNSLCHVALGTVASWLHQSVAGLARDPAVVGWRRALVAPECGDLTWARAAYDSRIGRYAVDWRRIDPQVVEVDVEVPVGGEAGVRLTGELVEPVDGLRLRAGRTVGTLPAGWWTLRVRQETGAGPRSLRA